MNDTALVELVQQSPFTAVGAIVGGVLAVLLILARLYTYLRNDTSITSAQSTVIMLLRQEVERLDKRVNEISARLEQAQKENDRLRATLADQARSVSGI